MWAGFSEQPDGVGPEAADRFQGGERRVRSMTTTGAARLRSARGVVAVGVTVEKAVAMAGVIVVIVPRPIGLVSVTAMVVAGAPGSCPWL